MGAFCSDSNFRRVVRQRDLRFGCKLHLRDNVTFEYWDTHLKSLLIESFEVN